MLFISSNKSPGSTLTPTATGVETVTNNFASVPAGDELLNNLKAAGLEALASEGTVLHTHQHLDIVINDKSVPVPPEIGIGATFISPIHSHDTSGILHVESPVQKDFYLSQFFMEWGITLTNTCLGTYCTDATHKLIVGINGAPVSDVSAITLQAHDEIEIWYGDKNTNPTLIRSYSFPAGL